MGERTGISWCHHTFNAWEGCQRVSPACENCYAEALNSWLRKGENWGPGSPRRFFGDAHWAQLRRWHKAAVAAGERRRVFVNSISDIGEDRPDLHAPRARLWTEIENTPGLDYLLLTKRIENLRSCLPWGPGEEPWPNVWIGVTAENQEWADDRIPELQRTRAAVRFVSYEPALGPIDWAPFLSTQPNIHWIIFGDESGRHRRDAELDWARATRDACAEHGVSFHFKQWCGEPVDGIKGERTRGKVHLPVLDGRRHAEFPAVAP